MARNIAVRTAPDMDVDVYEDATDWSISPIGVLTISDIPQGDTPGKLLAAYNSMGWISVWYEDDKDKDQ